MSQPSVGRVVHYTAPGSGDGVYPPACRAAIVAEVSEHEDSTLSLVTLMIVNPTGIHFREQVLGPSDPAKHDSYTWHWPERTPE